MDIFSQVNVTEFLLGKTGENMIIQRPKAGFYKLPTWRSIPDISNVFRYHPNEGIRKPKYKLYVRFVRFMYGNPQPLKQLYKVQESSTFGT